MSKKVKIFVGIVGVIILGILGSSFIKGKKDVSSAPSSNILSTTPGAVPLPGVQIPSQNADEFSSILATINRITIDTSLLQQQSYKLLRNVPVSLGTDVVGRVNPFAPIGFDTSLVGSSDFLIQTIQAGKITKTSAEFAAQITVSDTVPTSVVFEYGTSDTFGNATAPVTTTKGGTVLVTATNLVPDTLYYVRAVALRGSITTTGNTTSFVTIKK